MREVCDIGYKLEFELQNILQLYVRIRTSDEMDDCISFRVLSDGVKISKLSCIRK